MEKFLDYFKPEYYQLELSVFTKKRLIRGTSIINGEISSTARSVKFHAVDMTIESVSFCSLNLRGYIDDKSELKPCKYKYKDGVLEIPLTSEMRSAISKQAKQNYNEDLDDRTTVSFKIEYEAPIKTNMQGCYLSSYEYGGKKREIVATQFESHYAREAFPCIDEPAAKARFSLALLTPDIVDGDVVLANTPLMSKDENRYAFAETPRMSTYLLAWVIGPLKSVSTTNAHGVRVTSYCALNHPAESLLFANDTAARALDYYDEKFGVKYPLEKLDQVALPDFEAGAMENWGLVTYRESMMLADKTSAMDTKSSVALTVTHELSHQWFGNLVTMAWWDDLWLNESFASMMEYFCTDALYPEYKVWQDFFTHDCLAALRRDCLPGVQAVQQPVSNPSEIATLFDGAIVYAKGARLMLMLNRLIGDEKFCEGIKDYFKRYAYGNTVGDNLWDSLQPYADFAVKEFMHAWISQPGYPALLDGEQHRFLIDGTTDSTSWPIPEVFDDMSGHYLISLTDAEFEDKLAHFSDQSTEQHLRLLIDRSLLSKTTAVASSSLLDLLPKFVAEESAAVWSVLGGIIGDLKLFCPPASAAAENYKKYLSRLFKPRFDAIDYGNLGADPNALQLRDALLGVAIYVRDAAALKSLDDLYLSDLKKIDSELRGSVLLAHLISDETSAFPHYLEAYKSTSDPELRSDLLFVLAAFSENSEHLDTLLSLLSNTSVVRPQDHIFLYIYLLRNHLAREKTLDWLIENWPYVEKLTGEKSIEDYPRYAAALIRTPKEAAKFYGFFDSKSDNPILRRTLKMAHVEIDSRLALIDNDTAGVVEKLAKLTKEG